MFIKVSHQKTAEIVTKQIVERIDDGSLRIGQMLPPEKELEKEFGVSRTCIREALRILEAVGVIQVKRGKGSYIIDTFKNRGSFIIWTSIASMHRDEIIELMEIRGALAARGASLAAKNASTINFSVVEEVLQTMRAEASRIPIDLDLIAELDVKFHENLALSSGNKVLARLIRRVGESYKKAKGTFCIEGRPQESVDEHEKILRSIQTGNAGKANELVIRHGESVRADFELLLQGERIRPE